jgi:maltokinase
VTTSTRPAAGASAALAARLVPHLVTADAVERPITVDQTNASVVVDESVIVKWLAQPVPVPHPGTRLMAHLSAVGFDAMPTFHGELVVDDMVHATVTQFVVGSLDGWDWCVDELAAELSNGDTTPRSLQSARRIASIVADLHRALAVPGPVIDEPVVAGDLANEADRGERLLAEALQVLEGDPARLLRRGRAQIAAAIAALRRPHAAAIQPIHGDLHVGQVLRAGDMLVLNDFDGDPVTAAGQHLLRRSPLVDLAALLQSFDHVGRIVVRRRLPDRQAAVDTYISAAVAAAREVYAAETRTDLAAVEQELYALRIIQELHEMIYAHRSLPRWMYVPEAALTALLAG